MPCSTSKHLWRGCKILSWGKSQSWSLSLSQHQGVLPSVKASLHMGSLLGNNVLMMKEMAHKHWAFIRLYSSVDSLKSNKHLHNHSAVCLKESDSVSSDVHGMLCLSPALWVSFWMFFQALGCKVIPQQCYQLCVHGGREQSIDKLKSWNFSAVGNVAPWQFSF